VVEALPNVKNCGCGQSFSTRPGGRPGPRPGFRVLTGSILIFKKIQNGVVLVKKKKTQRVTTGFLTGFCRVSRVMAYAIFSSTRPGSSPGPGFKTLAAGEPHPQPQYQTATKCCGGITVPPHPMYYELHITTVIHHAFLLLLFLYFFIFFQLSPFFFFFFVFLSKITFFFQLFSVFFFLHLYFFPKLFLLILLFKY
jgi:hypothetical protein